LKAGDGLTESWALNKPVAKMSLKIARSPIDPLFFMPLP
jgi:hypothetical protein